MEMNKCPSCGGKLNLNSGRNRWVCPYCDSEFQMEIEAKTDEASVINKNWFIYEWDYKKLKVSPCRYAGSPYQNDLVIVAHNYQSHFGKISNLSAGAEVIYTDAEGTIFSYEVAGLEIIEATDIEGMINSEWDLTLFTCTYGGAQRYAVRCNLMIK